LGKGGESIKRSNEVTKRVHYEGKKEEGKREARLCNDGNEGKKRGKGKGDKEREVAGSSGPSFEVTDDPNLRRSSACKRRVVAI